jgi:endonuclease-3 related protein
VTSLTLRDRLLALYDALYAHFGHEPHWWPIVTDTPQFEILIGAVLVQQTRWETVEAAVVRLRDAGLLSPVAIVAADTAALAALIRPCAFHGQKAPGLQAICRYIAERYGGDLGAMLARERAPLRAELLSLPRIGRETADTIMLYAGGHPVFVVDAYTRRLFARLGLAPGFDFTRARYDAIQELIEGALMRNVERGTLNVEQVHSAFSVQRSALRDFYWNFHALIVEECIHHCLATNPRQDRPGARRTFVDPRKCAEHCLACRGCPLRGMCAMYLRRETEDRGQETGG